MASKSVTLTTKQQKHTLSAKVKAKKITKRTFKFALAQTFPRYWPQLDEQQSHKLQDLLKNVQATHPQWFAEKKAGVNNRPIHYGLQSSIRKLKTGHIKLLTISADLKPRYVANQIILQALACNDDIRILCVPNLETLTRPILNFSCYAFVIDNWSQFPVLDKWTATLISENFPIPSIIETYFAQRKNNKIAAVVEPKIKPQKLNEVENIEINRFYLTRENGNDNQRAFVPKNAIDQKPITFEIESLNKIKLDFISLDTYDSHDDRPTCSSNFGNLIQKRHKKHNKSPLALYRDLTVHKVQNNPNKFKKPKQKKNNKNKMK